MEWVDTPAGMDLLTMWFQMWIEGFVRILAVVVIGMVVAAVPIAIATGFWRSVHRERFWCRLARRQVDVAFQRSRPFGPFVAVASCSAFDPATSVSCARRCTDPAFRVPWEPTRLVAAGRG